MARRSTWLVVIVGVLAESAIAQTSEEIADAIERLDGPREDARAIEFLIDAGKPAVEPLLTEFTDDHEVAQDAKFARILRILRSIGEDAGQACPGLLVCTRRAPHGLRDDILVTLGQLLRFAPVSATELRESALQVDRRSFRAEVSLGSVPTVRLKRRATLFQGSGDGGTVRARLDADDPLEREFAAELRVMQDREALSDLVAILEDPDQPVVVAVAQTTYVLDERVARELVWAAASKAIARIAPDHPKAVRGLAVMVEFADDPRDRVRAAAALGRHGDTAKDYVDVLVAALDSDDDRLVAESVTSLGMIGVADEAVIERLRTLTEDPRPAIAERAKAALRTVEKRHSVDKRASDACARRVPGQTTGAGRSLEASRAQHSVMGDPPLVEAPDAARPELQNPA